ncbi:MAG: transcriptional regulator NrdR [Phycisphaerales bacterium]|jgi:transcriptional repressor NrdR|nr:transcriptional regulator NrdR [Phycisphaerales bacterium]
MICPYCGKDDDKVIDSRASEGGKVIRRRRECLGCEKRFTTYERVEQTARLMVIKRDGTREPFNRENMLKGIQAACGKRPISEERLQALVEEVEDELHREHDREVETLAIGERLMAKLRELDEVAYIRYASEYHQFRTLDELMVELREMMNRPKDVKDQQGLFGTGA